MVTFALDNGRKPVKLPVVITAAGPSHSHLLHQTLATPENQRLTIARFLLDLVADSAQRVALIVSPGSADSIRALTAGHELPVTLIEQKEPRGYANALAQARDFTAGEPFLHLVGDHFYLAQPSYPQHSLISALVSIFEREQASISAVQPTREALIGSFGTVAGPAVGQHDGRAIYQIEAIREKPTPTEAEQFLVAPGLRAGQYLCFFGVHLFTPELMTILNTGQHATVSDALQALAQRERYLGYVLPGRRFDLGSKYGLLQAQLAMCLQSQDRAEVVEMMLELLAR
jgi:UTP--glucose-1-phosphate uridylyltransferase